MTTPTTTRILSALGFEGARVHVTVCGDERIRALNKAHRGLDRATDVLAFPQEHLREGRFVRRSPAADAWRARKRKRCGVRGAGCEMRQERRAMNPAPRTLELDLGDVVISRDAVARQAREYRVSEAEEWTRLIVHGVLHLLGWDHARPGERARMRGLENRLVVEVM